MQYVEGQEGVPLVWRPLFVSLVGLFRQAIKKRKARDSLVLTGTVGSFLFAYWVRWPGACGVRR